MSLFLQFDACLRRSSGFAVTFCPQSLQTPRYLRLLLPGFEVGILLKLFQASDAGQPGALFPANCDALSSGTSMISSLDQQDWFETIYRSVSSTDAGKQVPKEGVCDGLAKSCNGVQPFAGYIKLINTILHQDPAVPEQQHVTRATVGHTQIFLSTTTRTETHVHYSYLSP